jgi:Glycosyl transferases group 1
VPSLAEGLPLAILEAMACARAVVATPVGGVPEAVVDGTTGLLVPPRDPDTLAAAVTRLVRDRDLARRTGAEGRRRVETHFSLERFVADVQTLTRKSSPGRLRRPPDGAPSGRSAPPKSANVSLEKRQLGKGVVVGCRSPPVRYLLRGAQRSDLRLGPIGLAGREQPDGEFERVFPSGTFT